MDHEGRPPLDFSGVRLKGGDRWAYQQIADVITTAVTCGDLHPGDQVPSEKYLVDVTGASLPTVRHALAHLRERGILYTVPRLGSFIAGPGYPRAPEC